MIILDSAQLISRLSVLPKELRDAIESNITADTLMRISDLYHLSDEKSKGLVLLVGNVLMGMVYYNDFARDLEKETHLNSLICQSIAKEVDREIFAPVRKYLRQVYKPISEAGEVIVGNVGEVDKDDKNEIIQDFKVEMPSIGSAIIKPEEKLNTPSFEKPVEASDKKSFLSFLRFKKTDLGNNQGVSEIGANTIVGKQEGIKPTLESPTSFVISFDDVQPQKEKIVSRMDFEGKKNIAESAIKPEMDKPMAEPINVGTIISHPEISENKSASDKPMENAFKFVPPVKIINYGLESGKMESGILNVENKESKIEGKKSEILEKTEQVKTIRVEKPIISEVKVEIKPEVKSQIESLPISEIKEEVLNKPEEKKVEIPIVPPVEKIVVEQKKENQQKVNPDNVVDLRKFKF